MASNATDFESVTAPTEESLVNFTEPDVYTNTTHGGVSIAAETAMTIAESNGVAWTLVVMVVAAFIYGGNGLVMLIIARTKQLRTNTNLFVFQLALADFFVGLQLLSRFILLISEELWNSHIRCQLGVFITMLSGIASSLFLVCIGVERAVGVFRPYRYNEWLTTRRMGVVSAGVWLYSALFATPSLVPRVITWQPGEDCYIYNTFPSCYLHLLVVQMLGTLVIITCLYAAIMVPLRRQLHRLHEAEDTAHVSRRSNLKILKTFAMLVGIFAVCWIPSIIIMESRYFGFDAQGIAFVVLLRISHCLYLVNSIANPAVYALRMTLFRAQMKAYLCCRASPTAPLEMEPGIN